MKVYAVVAAFSSRVPDAALAALVEDDRLVKQLAHIHESTQQELDWLAALDMMTWERLAALVGDYSPHKLRSWCLQAGHIAHSYFLSKAVGPASEAPWSLLQGDIEGNLVALKVGPAPVESTTHKIWSLMQLG